MKKRSAKRILINIICLFIPIKRYRKLLRSKIKQVPVKEVKQNKFHNNKILLVQQNGNIIENPTHIPGIQIEFLGDNNYIEIHEPCNFWDSKIVIRNAKVIIQSGINSNLIIESLDGKFSEINIGKNFTSSGTALIQAWPGKANVTIGEDCMFSWDTKIKISDNHVIFDKDSGKILNPNKDVVIGNHVWLGWHVFILKGSQIGDNSIIGAGSTVTKAFKEQNVIITGNPAKIIRRGIGWDRANHEEYLRKFKK